MAESSPSHGEPVPPPARKHATKPAQKALAEVRVLRTRVTQLEQEVQECRQLNKRLAEIADVVAEVLLPAEHRDEQRLRDVLADYERTI